MSDLSHWVVLQKPHWVRDLSRVLDFREGGGPILIPDLVEPMILRDLQTILQRFLENVFEISFEEKKFIFL